MYCLVGEGLQSTVTKSMKEVVDGSTWVQPTIAVRNWNILICVVDSVCTWVQSTIVKRHDVQICVVYNMKEQVLKYVEFQKLEVVRTDLMYTSTAQL